MPTSATRSLRWSQVAAWRAARHHLDRRVPRRRHLLVTSELCGLHAQVMSSADLTLWARVEGWRPSDLSDALWGDRTLVKTWAMRGTLHLFPSLELPLWQAALSSSASARRERWARYLGVAADEMQRLIDAIAEALDGRLLTREELTMEVTRRRRNRAYREALRESWGGILKPAAYAGALCFAPSDGQRVRFTNPRSWLDVDGAAPDPEDARREVFRRFIATYGPVSSDDVARWWSEGSSRQADVVIRSLGDAVVAVDVDGTAAWTTAEVAQKISSHVPPRSVRLLPGFDQYVIGSTKHSARLIPGEHRARVHRQAGWVSPVLAVDGMLEGVWAVDRTRSRVAVTVEPFRRQAAWVRRGAEAEAVRLAGYLGADLELRWS